MKKDTAWFRCCKLVAPIALCACFSTTDSTLSVQQQARITVTPSTLPADGVSAVAVQVALGSAVGIETSEVTVRLQVTLPGASIVQPGLTDADGIATGTLRSTEAGQAHVTATAWLGGGDVLLGTSAPVTFEAVTPSDVPQLSLSVEGDNAMADGEAALKLTILAQDAQGRALTGRALAISSSQASDRIVPIAPVTGPTGLASTQVFATRAGTRDLSATLAGGQASVPASFVAGAISGISSLQLSSIALMDNGVSQVQGVVVVTDAFGNPVAGVQVALTSSRPGDVLTQLQEVTDANGELHFTLITSIPGSLTITAVVGTVVLTQPVQVVSPPPSQLVAQLGVEPNAVVANGASAANVTVTIADEVGKPVGLAAVSLATNAAWVQLGDHNGVTDATGQWSTTATSTVAGAIRLTVNAVLSVPTAGQVASQPASNTVNFVPGPPVAGASTLVTTPQRVVADGRAQAAIVLVARDARQNVISGAPVIFVAGGGGAQPVPTSGTTDAAGTFVAYLSSTVAQDTPVQIALNAGAVGTVSLGTVVHFVAGAMAASQSTLAAVPATLVADGTSTVALTLTARDAFGNPRAFAPIVWATSGPGNTLEPQGPATDANGTASATLVSTTAGTKWVSTSVDGVTLTAGVTFVAGAPQGATSTLTVNPPTLVADGNQTGVVAVVVRDVLDNPVPLQPVQLSASGAYVWLGASDLVTDANGLCTTSVSSGALGAATLSARFAGTQVSALVTFIAGPPQVATSLWTASPNSLVADGSSRSTLTLGLFDTQNHPVAGQHVTLTADIPDVMFDQAELVTDDGGHATTSVASTVAASTVITASGASGLQLGTAITFLPGPIAAARSALTASPNAAIADGNAIVAVAMHLRDAYDNPVPSQPIAFASTQPSDMFVPSSGLTDATGQVTAVLRTTVAGSRTLWALSGSMTWIAPVTFWAGNPNANQSSLTCATPVVTADGTSLAQLTYLARDTSGNAVANQNVTFFGSGSSNAFVPGPNGCTDAAGMATVALTSTRAEAKTVTASCDGAQSITRLTFVAGAPRSSTSSLVASPNVQTAGAASVLLMVLAEDSGGNPVANQNVALTASGTANLLSPPAGQTDASGLFLATLSSTTAEVKTVRASLTQAQVHAQVTFGPNVPAAPNTTITASIGQVTADGNSQVQLIVVAKDAYGNLVPGAAVQLSASGSDNWFVPASGVTDAAGTFSTGLRSDVAEAKRVTATVGGNTGTAVQIALNFVPVSAAGPVSTFMVSPSRVVADGTSTAVLTLQLVNADGNPVGGHPITVSAPGGSVALSPSAGTTDANGQFMVSATSTTAEVATLLASDGNVFLTAQVTFVAGAAFASASNLVAEPNATTADSLSACTLTATVRDAFGNPVPWLPMTFGELGSGVAQLDVPGGTTDATGTVIATATSTLAGPVVFEAIGGGIAEQANVTFGPGPATPSTSTWTADVAQSIADGNHAITLTLVARDAQGNPVPLLPVALESSLVADTFDSPAGATDVQGLFVAHTTSEVAGPRTLTANAGTMRQGLAVTYVPGPPSQVQSLLTVAPAAVTADGISTCTVTYRVRDAFANAVADQNVVLTSSDGADVVLQLSGGMTDAGGTYTAQVRSSLAGAKLLTASIGNATNVANVDFIAGAATGSTSFIVANPNVQAAGSDTMLLTVHAQDATHNPVPNQSVALSATGAGDILTPTSGVTDASGTFVATLASTVAQTQTVRASFAGGSAQTRVVTTPGAPASPYSSLTANVGALSADGVNAVQLTAAAADLWGNPIAGATVALSVSGSHNVLGQAAGTTDGTGAFVTTLKSTTAEAKVITALVTAPAGSVSSGSTTVSLTLPCTPGPPAAAYTTFVASPGQLVADGASTASLNLRVADAYDNAVPSAAVTFTTPGAAMALSATGATTDADGKTQIAASSTVAQSTFVTATTASIAVSTPLTLTVGNIAAATSTLVASPNSILADGVAESLVTFAARDAFGNAVPNLTTSLAPSDAANLVPTAGATGPDGTLAALLSGTVAGALQVTATAGGVALAANVTLSPGPAMAAKSSLLASPTVAVADGNSAIVLTLVARDAQGNAITQTPVALASDAPQDTFAAGVAATDAGGQFIASTASTLAGPRTLTATVGAMVLPVHVTYVAGPAQSAQSQLVAVPTHAPDDGISTITLSYTLRDAFSNPLAGAPVALTATGVDNAFGVGGATGVTDVSGLFVGTLASDVAEPKVVTVQADSATNTVAVSFLPTSAQAATSTLTASPNVMVAGPVPTQITVTLRDATHNPVPNQAVSLVASGTANAFGQTLGQTDASGTFITTFATTQTQVQTVTATFAGTSVYTQVNTVAGAPALPNTTLSSNVGQITADGSSTATLTLVAKDLYANPVAGARVQLGVSGSRNALSANDGYTDTAGTFVATLASTLAELKTVTAQVGGSQGATVSLVLAVMPGGPAAANTSFIASPNVIVADGASTVTLAFAAADAQNNPIAGAPVAFAASSPTVMLGATSGITDAQGVAWVSATSTVAQAATVVATAQGFSLQAQVQFVAGNPYQAGSTLTVVPGIVVADGTSEGRVDFAVMDAFGNPVPACPVSLSQNGTATFAAALGQTGADGHFTTCVSSARAQVTDLQATADGGMAAGASSITEHATITFVASSADAAHSTWTASPNAIVADGNQTVMLMLAARDAYGNAVPAQSVILTSDHPDDAPAPAVGTTDAQGNFIAQLAATRAGTHIILAAMGSTVLRLNVVFLPGPPASATSSLTTAPDPVFADGAAMAVLSVLVKDAYGNAVPQQPVTLWVGGSHNVLAPPTAAATNAEGVTSMTLASTAAENKTVTAQAGGATVQAVAHFVAGGVDGSASSITLSPNALAAGTAPVAVQVTARDAHANPVANQGITLAALGTGTTLTPNSGATNAMGQFFATLATSVAQAEVVRANFGATSVQATLSIGPDLPATPNTTLTASRSQVTADGTDTAILWLLVRDRYGNSVPGAQVALAVDGSHNVLWSAGGTADATGTFVSQLSSTTAETKNITARVTAAAGSGGGSTVVSLSLPFVASSPSSQATTFVASPNEVTADGVSTATATLTVADVNANPIAGAQVQFGTGTTGAQLSCNANTTDTAGRASVVITGTVAQLTTLSATIGSLTDTTQLTFIAGGAVAANTSLIADPVIVTADGLSAATLIFSAQDAFFNPVPALAVTFGQTGPGTLTQATATTGQDGTCRTMLVASAAGQSAVAATAGGVAGQANVLFVAGAVAPSQSSFTASPATATADGNATLALALVARDARGNPVSGQAVAFAFAVADPGDAIAPQSTVTDAAGQASAQASATVAGLRRLTASVGGISFVLDANFVAGPANSLQSQLTVNPSALTDDGVSATALTFVARDALGNPVPNQGVQLACTGSHNTFAPAAEAITDLAGTATATLTSTTAEAKTVTAMCGGAARQARVTFVAGPAASSTSSLTASPTTQTAGDAQIVLTVTAQDVGQNPVPNQTVVLSGSGTANIFEPASGVTNASGTFVATLASTLAQAQTIRAALGPAMVQANVVIDANMPVAPNTTLTANVAQITADGANTAQLTLRAKDAYGNPVPGIAVSMAGSGSEDVFSPLTGATSAQGTWTTAVSSTVAQTDTLTATLGGPTGLQVALVLRFVAGSPSATFSSFTINPVQITADGVAAATLTLSLADAYANPIPNAAVTFLASSPSLVLSSASGVTSATGQLAIAVRSTAAQTATLQAASGGITLTQTASFVAGAPSAATSMLSISPNALTADGQSAAIAAFVVKDAFGNPVLSEPVLLTQSGSATFGHADGQTDAAGAFSTTILGVQAGIDVIVASAGSVAAQANVTFLPGAAQAATSTWVASDTGLTADGNHTIVLALHVLDAHNNAVANQPVSLQSSEPTDVLVSAMATTDTAGRLVATASATVAGPHTYTATAGAATLVTATTWVPGPANSAHSHLTACPGPTVADGNASCAIVYVVRDAFNNPIANQNVLLTTGGSHDTFVPQAAGVTDATGTYLAALASPLAEVKSIVGTAGAATDLTFTTFVAGAVLASASSLTASPNVLTAGPTPVALFVVARDANGNPTPNQGVTLSAMGAATGIVPRAGVTAADGTMAATLTTTVAQTQAVRATLGTVTLSTTVTINPNVAAAATTTLVANLAQIIADGSSTAVLTLTARDMYGNLVPHAPVAFNVSGSNNTLVPAGATTDNSGSLTTTLSSTRAESKTITAQLGPDLANVVVLTLAFVPGAPSLANSTLMASPNQATADGTTVSLSLRLADAHQNPVPGASITFSANAGSIALTPTAAATDAAGLAVTQASTTVAQAATFLAAAGGTNLSVGVNFVSGAASTATSSLVADPNVVTADGASTSTLRLALKDAFSNPIAQAPVALGQSAGGALTFANASGTTASDGTFVTQIASTQAAADIVLASAAGITRQANVTFVAGNANLSQSSFAAAPQGVIADGVHTIDLSLLAQDAFGNAVAHQVVTFGSSVAADAFAPPGGSTDANGRFTATVVATQAGPRTLTATVGSMVQSAAATFVAGPPAAAQSTLAVSPPSVTADGNSLTTLTYTVRDAYNNPVPNQGVAFAVTGSHGVFATAATGSTDAAGVFVATLASTVAEAKTITAQAGGATNQAQVIFVPGAVQSGTSSIVASPNAITAGAAPLGLRITARDATGNAVPSQAVTLSASGSANTFSPSSGTTDANGAFTATLASTLAQTETVRANFAGASVQTSVAIVAGAPASPNTTILANVSQVTADGQSPAQVTVVAKDAWGNPVAGAPVTLTAGGSNNVISPTSGTTDAQGSFIATWRSTVAEAKSIQAQVGSGATAIVQVPVTFLAGPAASGTTTLVSNQAQLVADGTSQALLTLRVADASNNPIAGSSVTFTASTASVRLGPTGGVTDASGRLVVAATSTVAQLASVQAATGSINVAAPITFVPGAIDATHSTLALVPGIVTADGTSTSDLTFIAQDTYSNVIPFQPVALSQTGNATFLAGAGQTASNGVFSTTLTSTQAAVDVIWATSGGVVAQANVIFVAGSVDQTQSSWTATPQVATADGNHPLALMLVARDAYRNPLVGQSVTVTAGAAADVVLPAGGVTDANGTFLAITTSQLAGARTLYANVGATTFALAVIYVPGPASAAQSSLTVSPSTVTADNASIAAITYVVRDAYNNVVGNQNVTLALSGSDNTVSQGTGNQTNAAGTYAATIASDRAEVKTIAAGSGGAINQATVTFVAGPAAAATSAFTVQSANTVADGNALADISVRLADAYNNVVPNQNVTFTSTGSANVLRASQATTDATGVAHSALASTVAEVKAVQARFNGTGIGEAVTFVAGPAAAAMSALSISPNQLTTDNQTTAAVTVVVRDAFSNPVAFQAVTYAADGVANTFSAATATTNAAGSASVALASTRAQNENITASFAGLALSAPVAFLSGAPSVSTSTLVASPNNVTADGVAASTLTVTVRDAQNNAVGNAQVVLSGSGTNTTFGQATGTSAANGLYVTTATSIRAQAETIVAALGSGNPAPTVSITLSFVAGPSSSANSTLVANPNSITADGATAITLTVTALDAYNNPLAGAQVVLTASGSTNAFGATMGTTNAQGVWSTQVTSTLAQTENITATVTP